MNNQPTAALVLRRPYLKAVVRPECPAGCDDGFTYDPRTDTGGDCRVCGPARQMVIDYVRASLPAATWGATRHKLKVPEKLQVLPKRAWESAQSGFDEAIQTAADFENDSAPDEPVTIAGVVGPAGTGKTWLVVNAIISGIRAGVPSLYVDATDPYPSLGHIGNGSVLTGMMRVQNCPLVALDGIGGHRSDKAAALIRDMITQRHSKMLVTLLSSSQSKVEIARQLGATVADLLVSSAPHLTHGSLRSRS